jgi:hypothetical protein
MQELNYQLDDCVEMKKAHPCGANRWQIVRLGMDIRIRCTGCNHSVLLSRKDFEKRLKRILPPVPDRGSEE